MTTLSTHVLDAVHGAPAAGLAVDLAAGDRGLAHAETDADGRVRFDADLAGGLHTLTFGAGAWFAAQERDTFFPSVSVTFEVDAGREHHHVALLLSPYAYTTYQGS